MIDNIKVLITPVDLQASNAVQYKNKLPDNWQFAYKLKNIDPDNLWSVHTKIDNVEIYLNFNSVLIAVRPELGIFGQWRDMFENNVKNGYFRIITPFSNPFFFTD